MNGFNIVPNAETLSKLMLLQKHIIKKHAFEPSLESLAADVLQSALAVYAPKAYCKRCQDERTAKGAAS